MLPHRCIKVNMALTPSLCAFGREGSADDDGGGCHSGSWCVRMTHFAKDASCTVELEEEATMYSKCMRSDSS
jgi:hypothetical protein